MVFGSTPVGPGVSRGAQKGGGVQPAAFFQPDQTVQRLSCHPFPRVIHRHPGCAPALASPKRVCLRPQCPHLDREPPPNASEGRWGGPPPKGAKGTGVFVVLLATSQPAGQRRPSPASSDHSIGAESTLPATGALTPPP